MFGEIRFLPVGRMMRKFPYAIAMCSGFVVV